MLHDDVPPGARADELDTLDQVRAVAAALRSLGHEATAIAFALDLDRARRELLAAAPAFVFNLIESVDRRGALIHLAPALLDTMRLPYTGVRTEALFVTSSKPLSKRMLRAAGVRTPEWLTRADLASDGPVAPGRWIVKSSWEHASIGLEESSVVEASTRAELRTALDARLDALAGEGFVEQFIDGREFNIGLLGGLAGAVRILPHAEIAFENWAPGRPRVVGWKAKWDEQSDEHRATVRRYDFPPADAALLEELSRVGVECWRCFGLRGYARVDVRVDCEGRIFVLEVNANPCLTPGAGFCAAAERAGLSLTEIVRAIVAQSLER